MRRLLKAAVVAVALVTAGLVPSGLPIGRALAANPTPPFTQCPAVGADTSCALLIVINPGGGLTILQDASQGPYDGIEDTLLGVLNNSGAPVSSITLQSTVDAFGFDGDGICTYGWTGSQCPYGTTGYEGPNTSFSNIGPGGTSGTVNFPNMLANNASTFFSLEEALSAQQLQSCSPGFTPTKTISGNVPGNVNVTQPTLIDGATIGGSVTVQPGADVMIKNSTINGGVTSTNANSFVLSGSTVNGPVSVTGTVGKVLIGADGGCTGNKIRNLTVNNNKGTVEVNGNTTSPGAAWAINYNTGGVEIEGNTVNGSLDCRYNAPPPTDNNVPNTVTGRRTGQCATLTPVST